MLGAIFSTVVDLKEKLYNYAPFMLWPDSHYNYTPFGFYVGNVELCIVPVMILLFFQTSTRGGLPRALHVERHKSHQKWRPFYLEAFSTTLHTQRGEKKKNTRKPHVQRVSIEVDASLWCFYETVLAGCVMEKSPPLNEEKVTEGLWWWSFNDDW